MQPNDLINQSSNPHNLNLNSSALECSVNEMSGAPSIELEMLSKFVVITEDRVLIPAKIVQEYTTVSLQTLNTLEY